jgi:hypothetical protein
MQSQKQYNRLKPLIKEKNRNFRYINEERKRKKAREKKRLWENKNKEKRKKQRKIWDWKNKYSPKRIWGALKYRSNRRGIIDLISFTDFIEWYNKELKICCYCKIKEGDLKKYSLHKTKKNVKRLTIERKNNSKGYIKGNLALSCFRCNFIKGNFFTHEEMLKIGKIIQQKR